MRRLLIVVLLLLVGGCAGLPPVRVADGESRSETQILQQAAALHEKRQWADAMALLTAGLDAYPESEPLVELRESVNRDWQLQKRNREDWILVHEVQALQKKLPYLENLVAIDPENYITKSRLLFWRSLLESKVADLIACGSLHLHLDKPLAEQCASLAEEIKPTPQSEHLLGRIRQEEAAEEKKAQAQAAVRSKQKLARRRDRLFKQATADFESGAYRESIGGLNQLLTSNPQDREARALLEQVTRERDREVDRLLAYGDRLYREEQIEQAVSVWESADKLAPGRTDIAGRIERAMKVLQKLQEIQQVE